ncbi:MAG: hypothetical protein SAJ37_21685, partial [Oscillatoria sp. PMC 1068.18]|nr:hypothetical protein [Oscillatoria sp. PMC 1068.18]
QQPKLMDEKILFSQLQLFFPDIAENYTDSGIEELFPAPLLSDVTPTFNLKFQNQERKIIAKVRKTNSRKGITKTGSSKKSPDSKKRTKIPRSKIDRNDRIESQNQNLKEGKVIPNPSLQIQELAIALSASNINPTMFTADFLQVSGIIPGDWELARKPVTNPRASQISYKNGVNVAAQPGTVTFFEGMAKKTPQEMQLSQVVRNSVEKLAQADYRAIVISPKSLFAWKEGEDIAKNFITNTLIAPGAWRDYGKTPAQATINFLYQLDRCSMSLSVNDARLQQQDKSAIPALLFSGNFNYNLAQYSPQERISQIYQRIDGWQTDFDTYSEIVNQRFLGQQQSVFPM